MNIEVLERIRDRKIIQWGLAYLAAAWLLVQVFHILGQQFDWPAYVLRALTVLLAFGLLPALVIAWYHGEKGAQKVSRVELGILTVLLVTGGVLAHFTAQRAMVERPVVAAAVHDPKTVAVLPFELLGDDPSDRHLAAGLHDELILNLARLAGLRVISRTSVRVYNPGERNLRRIADELRAGSVIEGTVQRINGQLRVRLQLIDASTDTHLWTDSFRGSEEEMFELKARMALTAAGVLGVQPTPDEVAAITVPPTSNPAALAAYNEALQYSRGDGTPQLAIDKFEEALAHDPELHAAHGFLAAAHSWRYAYTTPDDRPQVRETAEAHLEHVRAWIPDSPYRYLAEGTYRYYVEGDFETALMWLERAQPGLPHTSDLLSFFASVQGVLGRWDESLASYREATTLDPRNVTAAINYVIRLQNLWRYPEAHEEAERILRLEPDCQDCRFWWIWNLYQWSGDPAYIEHHLPMLSAPLQRASHELWAAVARRDVERALEIVTGPEPTYLDALWALPKDLHPAAVYMQAGEGGRGREILFEALPRLEEIHAAGRHARLVHARLLAEAFIVTGRCEEALTLMLGNVARAAPYDLAVQASTAVIELRCGERDAARARIQEFFASADRIVISTLSPRTMLTYPVTAPLADDPVIRALFEAEAAKLPPPPPLPSH